GGTDPGPQRRDGGGVRERGHGQPRPRDDHLSRGRRPRRHLEEAVRLLASPGFAAAGAVLLGAALHPALPSLLRPPLVAVAATALLLALALLIRPGGPGERLVGLGAVAIVGALASDGLRGHRGTLTLEVGQGTQSFEDQGPGGRALDAERRPYSRSPEPRNPAALLRVTRGSQSWRVFVIQAMPGIHRPEGLDRVLSLAGVAPRGAASLRVSHEPAAPVALAGVLLA